MSELKRITVTTNDSVKAKFDIYLCSDVDKRIALLEGLLREGLTEARNENDIKVFRAKVKKALEEKSPS